MDNAHVTVIGPQSSLSAESTAMTAALPDVVRDDSSVPMTAHDFLSVLTSKVPETQHLVTDHLADNGELLLHLLTADLLRYAIEEFNSGRRDKLGRLLSVVEIALCDGTEYVTNAMAVSFVEDTGWWDPGMQPFIDAWPSELRAEVERQRHSRPA